MSFLHDSEILQVLHGFNPWWRGEPLPAWVPRGFRRPVFHTLLGGLTAKRAGRATMLVGPRRVGKTTLLLQLVEALLHSGRPAREIFYVSWDHPALRKLPLERLLDLHARDVSHGRSPVVLLLDELQHGSDWDLWLKHLVDYRPSIHVLATGSAAAAIHAGGRESGVGRWTEVSLDGLSFGEYLRLSGVPVPALHARWTLEGLSELASGELVDLVQTLRPLGDHLHRYLLIGGFPEAVLAADLQTSQRLLRQDVIDKVLKQDLADLYHVRNVAEVEQLFLYLCVHSGGLLEVRNIARSLATTAVTASNHLQCLMDARLIRRIASIDTGGKALLKARPKVYLADTGLRNAVLLRGEEILRDAQELGLLVETACAQHLTRWVRDRGLGVGYWRSADSRMEVDFVVWAPAGVRFAIEVKYRERPALGPGDGLWHLMEQDATHRAILVTRAARDTGRIDIRLDRRRPLAAVALPAFALLYLLAPADDPAAAVGTDRPPPSSRSA